MKSLIIVLLSFFIVKGTAIANEQFQITNSLGIWKASWGSGAFGYFDLFITSSADGKTLKIEHCTLDIEFSGKCTSYDNIVGHGVYSLESDSIQITESNGSPTPTYKIRVNPKDSNSFERSWGAETISYFKL